MLNFDIETTSEGTSALIRVRGDLDIQVADRATDEVEIVEATEPALLVFDLSGLSFLDSTGMGVIAAAHGRAEQAGRRFAVVRPPYGVRRAFELSGLDEVITVADDLADVYP